MEVANEYKTIPSILSKDEGKTECRCGKWLKRHHAQHCHWCGKGIIGEVPYILLPDDGEVYPYCSSQCQDKEDKELRKDNRITDN